MTDLKANPYDWTNPIRDQNLFAGRKQELDSIMQEIIRTKETPDVTPAIVITGERRVGKTSILLRVQEKCAELNLKSILIPLDNQKVTNNWEFWSEVFSGLSLALLQDGIALHNLQIKQQMGFLAETSAPDSGEYMFPEAYKYYLSGARVQLSTFLIRDDVKKLVLTLRDSGYHGLVLVFDEAHLLEGHIEIMQHIRNSVQGIPNVGLVFCGETRITPSFTEPSEPFFGQAKIISVGNFVELNDVAQCCLQPLTAEQCKLMSPMTIQYILGLSRGKPNQIRLICSCIYKRYVLGHQSDLNVTIDVLDDVLESIEQSHEAPEAKQKVSAIQKLNSVDLEHLYNMTLYPNWSLKDIVDLNESFKGDCKSVKSMTRRFNFLNGKKTSFADMGLMASAEDRCQLLGGEFVSLYLRFFYETRKYGKLSKAVILGKGPPNLFGEVTDKLVTSLSYHFGQAPDLRTSIYHNFYRDFGHIMERVLQRFSLLERIMKGELKKPSKELAEAISECFTTCELIGKEGTYYLICLSVRNRDNPRQVIQVELYFNLAHEHGEPNIESLFKVLNQQAEHARVFIDGYRGIFVKIPDLRGLLHAVGVAFEDLLEKVPLLIRWRLSSVQHLLRGMEVTGDGNREESESKEDGKWIRLYGDGKEQEAEELVLNSIQMASSRSEKARLYNDLGYIRSSKKLSRLDFARKDLETALDLHYNHIQLTLLDLADLDILDQKYDRAKERIEDSLFLTMSPTETGAAYLRLNLPENRQRFAVRVEQNPANIIEAAYINLAFVTMKISGYDEGLKVLEEALELFPESICLRHAYARFLVYKQRVDLAVPIYSDLSEKQLKEKYINFELRHFAQVIKRHRNKSKAQ